MDFELNNEWKTFISEPFQVLKRIFDANSENEESFKNPLSIHFALKESIEEQLRDDEKLRQIPLLNSLPTLDGLSNNSVVRFRCMVQDMFDPEVAVASLQTVNDDGNASFKYSLYTDFVDERIDENIRNNVMIDRLKYYCISIPGENEWVYKGVDNYQRGLVVEKSEAKRSSDECKDNAKRMKTGDDSSDTPEQKENKAEVQIRDLCFPFKESGVKKCSIIKFYEAMNPIVKLNDIIEVIGIVDFETRFTTEAENFNEVNHLLSNLSLVTNDDIGYPYSLVPRIHALLVKPLSHINPLVVDQMSFIENKSFFSKIKCELKALLTSALFGNELAAEYLLYSIISKVFNRRDVTTVGSLAINFTNLPLTTKEPENIYLRSLYNLLASLTTNSYMLPLTIESLNKESFIPIKDYEANKLKSGILQMPKNTLLFIDETGLTPGQLSTIGLNNFNAIRNMIHCQRVAYEFHFDRIEYDTDVNVLVFSMGKSLFNITCKVSLKENNQIDDINKIFEPINAYLSEPLLNDIRTYLTLCKQCPYELSEEMQTFVQSELVSMMTAASQTGEKVDVDELHLVLDLSRLVAVSNGETQLTRSSWEFAKQLEQQRKAIQ